MTTWRPCKDTVAYQGAVVLRNHCPETIFLNFWYLLYHLRSVLSEYKLQYSCRIRSTAHVFFRRHHCSAKYEGSIDGDVPCIFLIIQSLKLPYKLSMRCVCTPLVGSTTNWEWLIVKWCLWMSLIAVEFCRQINRNDLKYIYRCVAVDRIWRVDDKCAVDCIRHEYPNFYIF